MNKLFILSGSSGAGKSALLSRITNAGICEPATKFSERIRFNTVDDVQSVVNISDPKLECDIQYSMYGYNYGFSSHNISHLLCRGNTMLITNSGTVIERLKSLFPDQVVVIRVVSDINERQLRQIFINRYGSPSIKSVEALVNERLLEAQKALEADDVEKLLNSLEEINSYIDDIILHEDEFRMRLDSIKNQDIYLTEGHLMYDYVVLNFYSSTVSTTHATEAAFGQLMQIIKKEVDV